MHNLQGNHEFLQNHSYRFSIADCPQAAATGATVILSNHSEFDNAFNKNRMLAGRGDGPHPYELGSDWVQRYFQVMQHSARAAQLRLEKQQAGL